ncbi:NAD(P)H-dependent oxidoreductase [Nonomuraea sp. KC401]|uniref:NADPH-dependent FMN reductase n=1 Tax=unclassified Nonomuraea TaxID=2593643 RepID=UPI0010FEF0B8|nr:MULTISPECIES: NADPH-dependent FMN reductase [unclassified Nonomuraea]NBE93251.1 ACP phosphodiesterase [Nonomuraea sp. K271]TLF78011.1 NAD(P)H-dependent oxidoreductase [Nonomuraea sp. KC401]
MTHTVGYIVGSLSRDSINRRLALALCRLAPAELALVEIPIDALPLYNRDLDPSHPPSAQEFKDSIASVDALLFITPEYNRSVPGALKNAIDWASRPRGSGVLDGKPAAMIGTSPGSISTAVAQQHLRTILAFADMPVMGQPEAYIQFTHGLIDEKGTVTVALTNRFLSAYMAAFLAHIRRHRIPAPVASHR